MSKIKVPIDWTEGPERRADDLADKLLAAGRTEIPLPGCELPVPQSITLAQVRERMYSTGPFVQATGVSESMCPE